MCFILLDSFYSRLFLSILFFFYLYSTNRDLHVLTHSFPTLRSSDLFALRGTPNWVDYTRTLYATGSLVGAFAAGLPISDPVARSEEHTSELQSLMRISYAVICLKKKKYTEKTQ